ncbi:M17 family metallopeptidase [Mycoplasma miroungirhinis]|uniref:Probable cytosol aminopeptidase n=1 Tax=Mycoplasma miroungirhinis TaxID=754516 RepID=A0A6M4JDS1_9MOLU|nr:M17 family metallopeptidase [Mycoplasma miroungirhinis]QJR44388.1 leucyl aminopeptidase family protein [Mycoplasma miroungirhinis]
MIKLINQKNDTLILKAAFNDTVVPEETLKEKNLVTDFFHTKESFVFLGQQNKFNIKDLRNFAMTFTANQKRAYTVDVASFVTQKVHVNEVVKAFLDAYEFNNADIFSLKTNKKETTKDLYLYTTNILDKVIAEQEILNQSVTFARNLQRTVPNIANSEFLADAYYQELSKYPNLKVTVLDKKAIEEQKMGLLLSVNRGSTYEPRLVVVEYNGNPKSNTKLALVGKGITFDSGGYSLKPSRYMLGMKYDMSGSAAVAATMKAVAELKPEANVVAIMPLTDNRVNGDASTPDSVWTSMSGKTVEINNTDAEGRLVLADGITYAIRNLKATKVLTIATLTGAILVALGHTFTGVWTSNPADWKALDISAKKHHELIWRMPLHEEFAKEIKNTKVADLKNTDLTGDAGSSSAAMFLKEFAENADFIHLDIAGTNDISDVPQGVMIKTMYELTKNIK